jgi:arylsulfatase A-like enzyme
MESLRPGLETLPEAFRDLGYRTAAVVANPWVATRKHGLDRGFEEYRYLEGADADALHRIAREILAEDDARPLFLYLHYMDVHAPYARPLPGDPALGSAPQRYRRALEEEELGKAPRYLRLPAARRLDDYVDAYDLGIRRWDRSFGDFTRWLDSTGRLDHTLVAVVADHGEEFLEHGGWNHGETLYQEQLLVPWILYIPGLSPRRIDDRVVSLIDVGPTLLGALEAKIPSTMAGRDLLSEAAGR